MTSKLKAKPKSKKGWVGNMEEEIVAHAQKKTDDAARPFGALQVWWIPQVPGKPFTVPVKTLEEGVKIMEVLADYDAFQFKHRIKPDYCNAGGIQRWCADNDGDGTPGWEDWYDEETGEDDPERFLAEKADVQV